MLNHSYLTSILKPAFASPIINDSKANVFQFVLLIVTEITKEFVFVVLGF